MKTAPYRTVSEHGGARPRIAGWHAAAFLMACGLVFCAGDTDESRDAGVLEDTRAVATIDGDAIPYSAFVRYLRDNMGDPDETGEQSDTVKSRLLDLFLEEQLLLRAAAELQIAVSEAEVDAYLKELGVENDDTVGGERDARAAFRGRVRRGLLLQKVKDQAVVSKIQVSPGEVEDYLSKRSDLLRQPRMVVLRQILVDDKSVAVRLQGDLVRDPSKFEALAGKHSVAPDHGQARTYQEEELPVELRVPLLALEAGQISAVLEYARRFMIFQMVRKIEAEPVDRDEVQRRVEVELFQRKIEDVLRQFIADLKEKKKIHVNRSILPFRYVADDRS